MIMPFFPTSSILVQFLENFSLSTTENIIAGEPLIPLSSHTKRTTLIRLIIKMLLRTMCVHPHLQNRVMMTAPTISFQLSKVSDVSDFVAQGQRSTVHVTRYTVVYSKDWRLETENCHQLLNTARGYKKFDGWGRFLCRGTTTNVKETVNGLLWRFQTELYLEINIGYWGVAR